MTGQGPDDRWRIGAFAARVGVPAATLRAWERRYGVLRPERTPAGYRLYTPDDERRVLIVAAQMRRGLSASQAADSADTSTIVVTGRISERDFTHQLFLRFRAVPVPARTRPDQ